MDRLGANYGWNDAVCAPRRGNLRIAQGRAKRRPGYCRPSPAFALQGQKRKNQRLLFVHTLHLLYMLLPLQGESAVVYSSPRAPLRSALGYEQVAPAGRTDGIIPPTIVPSQTGFFRVKNDLSSYFSCDSLAILLQFSCGSPTLLLVEESENFWQHQTYPRNSCYLCRLKILWRKEYS